jgi:hypothetical protein
MEGKKFDEGKPDLAFMMDFPDLMIHFCLALEEGKRKYGYKNYMKGLETRRVVAALLRHIQAHCRGEVRDPDTGITHLGYAVANLAMLSEMKGESDVQRSSD